MRSDRLKVVFMLCLAFVTARGKSFESKVAQLLRDETEDLKCFVEGKKDLTCFWEVEEARKSLHHQYTFMYSYENEDKVACAVSSLSLASNKTVLLCKLPQTLFFTALDVQVFRDGRILYNRSLNVENVLFVDPPRNLTVLSSGKEGQLNVSWLPPPLKYMDDSLIYEVRYAEEGSHMGKVEEIKASTVLVLRGLQSGTRYKVWVRVKPDGVSYKGYWSFWTDPVFAVTPPSDMDPLIVSLVLFIGLILCLLSLTVILTHHKFLLKKLWPDIPTPEHKFPGLFTVYKGDFKEWMSQNNGSMWGRSVHVYTEELPSPVEVLSEVSLASYSTSPKEERKPAEEEEESVRTDSGLMGGWREPPHGHWLMEQLRALQENPESLSQSTLLQSHDTYVALNQNSQRVQGEAERQVDDDVFEETVPLQTLFSTAGTPSLSASHSDLGSLLQSSGRLSSQSSFEYPNHTWPPKGPGYAYMAVADSGVSMDYSPMSSSRIAELGKRGIYTNEYKNEIFGHRWPLTSRHVEPGY